MSRPKNQLAVLLVTLILSCAHNGLYINRGGQSEPRMECGNASSGCIAGRLVTADSATPITYYGVVLARNFASPNLGSPPIIVRSSDGKFLLQNVSIGEWDLIVVGPNFARKTIVGVKVNATRKVQLGDVSVRRGFQVEGVVLRADLSPVQGARVELVQSGHDLRPGQKAGPDGIATQAMMELAKGNQSVTTDRRGHFLLTDVSSVGLAASKWRLFARTHSEMSVSKWIDVGNHASVNLTVLPIGHVSGAVERLLDGILIASPVSSPTSIVPAAIHHEMYQLELPAGTYYLDIVSLEPRQHRYRRKEVVIEASSKVVEDFKMSP
jgi:hypothetical protein